jgi:hypothetical protein
MTTNDDQKTLYNAENKFAMDKVLATEEAIAFSLEELLQVFDP